MHPLQPIFVGGTGRSGSTVTGYLLGAHADIWNTKPREIRFLTDTGGLLDLVQGYGGRVHPSIDPTARGASLAKSWLVQTRRISRKQVPVSPRTFMRGMYGPWWERTSPDGEPRGMHRGIEIEPYRAALERFDAALRHDRHAAAFGLIHELLDPLAIKNGAVAWADTTPQNAENAHRIVELLPDAKIIFMIRDGRDTCASVLQKQWGPADPFAALEWWRRGALRATKSMAELGPDQGITIRLSRLIDTDREDALRRLFEFVGHPITPEVRAFFDRRMPSHKGHVTRWRRDIPQDDLPRFSKRYGEIHEELTSLGLDLPAL